MRSTNYPVLHPNKTPRQISHQRSNWKHFLPTCGHICKIGSIYSGQDTRDYRISFPLSHGTYAGLIFQKKWILFLFLFVKIPECCDEITARLHSNFCYESISTKDSKSLSQGSEEADDEQQHKTVILKFGFVSLNFYWCVLSKLKRTQNNNN